MLKFWRHFQCWSFGVTFNAEVLVSLSMLKFWRHFQCWSFGVTFNAEVLASLSMLKFRCHFQCWSFGVTFDLSFDCNYHFLSLIWFFTSHQQSFKWVLLKDTTQWRWWGSNRWPLDLESSTLPLSHCATLPVCRFKTINESNLKCCYYSYMYREKVPCTCNWDLDLIIVCKILWENSQELYRSVNWSWL